MSIYEDITSGFTIEKQPEYNYNTQPISMKRPVKEQEETGESGQTRLTSQAKEILLAQNENQKMREKLAQNKEQIAWLSLKSINIGKEFMKLIKERDEKKSIIEKAGAKLEKYKKRNEALEQKLNILQIENQSLIDRQKFSKEDRQSDYEKACKKLDRILELTMANTGASQNTKNSIQNLIRQTKSLLEQ